MNNCTLYRMFDLLLSAVGLILGWPILLFVYCVGLADTGKPIFMQKRIGKNGRLFTLIKFRTMPIQTKSIATHLVDASSVSKIGALLRKTKLDELPQLINVLLGDMSFVGPRPCLDNQLDVIEEREKRGVLEVVPGITGLSQIRHIDMSTPKLLAETDAEMINTLTVRKYFQYIIATVSGAGRGDRLKD
ncbi:sugar transferase [Photobacterium leiognathi]|uniref:sugar transferase n=1 Tax=Photobacterium leiognathi TaxID=553611 RepID=UPI00273868AD|nr:sugar transferase [Photobacterium leiognathi]